jgi:hypothetical protein
MGERRGDPVLVDAGQTTANDEVRALIKERKWWQVETRLGQRIGCLVLDGHLHKHDGDIVLVSSARPCSSRSSTPIFRVSQ